VPRTSAAPASVPDGVEPVVGWRVWDVVELDGSLRLCSLAFWSVWLPCRAAAATCRRALAEAGLRGLPPHAAPQARCTCGIYATQTAAQVLAYSRGVRRRADTVHRVAGRAALWGTVVECEGGWRASHAYPAALYVPEAKRRALRPTRPALLAEQVAVALAEYRVPVELVACAQDRRLASLLEPRTSPS
jgi:hypothetical protein